MPRTGDGSPTLTADVVEAVLAGVVPPPGPSFDGTTSPYPQESSVGWSSLPASPSWVGLHPKIDVIDTFRVPTVAVDRVQSTGNHTQRVPVVSSGVKVRLPARQTDTANNFTHARGRGRLRPEAKTSSRRLDVQRQHGRMVLDSSTQGGTTLLPVSRSQGYRHFTAHAKRGCKVTWSAQTRPLHHHVQRSFGHRTTG